MEKNIVKFVNKYSQRSYLKGEDIISPGDENHFVYYLESGHVASYALDEEGNRVTLNIYKPGTVFPISEVLAGRVNDFYFESLDKVSVKVIPSQEFLSFLKTDKDSLFILAKNLSIGLEGFMIRTLYLIRSDARKKLASTILMMTKRFGSLLDDNKTFKILLPQSHEDIANLAGISRETVSIELKKMQDEGLVYRKQKHTFVNDVNRLKEISTIFMDKQPLPYSF